MVQLHILVVINYLQVVYAPPNQHLVDTLKKKKKKSFDLWLSLIIPRTKDLESSKRKRKRTNQVDRRRKSNYYETAYIRSSTVRVYMIFSQGIKVIREK